MPRRTVRLQSAPITWSSLLQASFTSDTELHHCAVDDSEQDSNLRQSLLQIGRGAVTALPFMLALNLPGFPLPSHSVV